MAKNEILYHEDFKALKHSVVLLQGEFEPDFFGSLKKRVAQTERVFVMEGRPSLRAGKIANRELLKRHIHPVFISDNMAGFLFAKEMVKEVWLAGIKREESRGLFFVGAWIVSVLAKQPGIPVLVAWNKRKRRLSVNSDELLSLGGIRVAPKGVKTHIPLTEWIPNYFYKERYE